MTSYVIRKLSTWFIPTEYLSFSLAGKPIIYRYISYLKQFDFQLAIQDI